VKTAGQSVCPASRQPDMPAPPRIRKTILTRIVIETADAGAFERNGFDCL